MGIAPGLRVLAGFAIAALFAGGIWLLSAVIADEAPRLDPAYGLAIWIGEASLALYLVRWMIFGSADRHGGRVLLGLLLSLGVDVGVTSFGYSREYAGHARSVETSAVLRDVQVHESHAVLGGAITSRHYRVVLAFEDAGGRAHEAALRFDWRARSAWPTWVEPELVQSLSPGAARQALRIRYDPELPARVWFRKQEWTRQHTLPVVFLTIHFFQLLTLFLVAVEAWGAGLRFVPQSRWRQHAPIALVAVEALSLAFLGLLALLRSHGG